MENIKKDKAIAYCRVATMEQAKTSDSLEIQKRAIAEYANHQNIEIVEWFGGISSGTHRYNEKGLEEALQYCKDHSDISYLVITEPNRISRSISSFYYWRDSFLDLDIRIDAVSETAEDEFENMMEEEALNRMFASLSMKKKRNTLARLANEEVGKLFNFEQE